MTFKNTPANQKKYKQCLDFYRANIEALPTGELYAIVRNPNSLKTRSTVVKSAIDALAQDELIKRGHPLPLLTSLFSYVCS